MDQPSREHCPPHGMPAPPAWMRGEGETAACAWCGQEFKIVMESIDSYGTGGRWDELTGDTLET